MDKLYEQFPPEVRAQMWAEQAEFPHNDDWQSALENNAELAAKLGVTKGQKVHTIKRKPVSLILRLFYYVSKESGYEDEEAIKTVHQALDEAGVEDGDVVDVCPKMPDVVDVAGKGWHVQMPDGTYQLKNEVRLRAIAEQCGISDNRVDGCPSKFSKFEAQVTQLRTASWAGALAGWPVGVHSARGCHILVTQACRTIQPKPDPEAKQWRHICAIIDGLFGLGTKEQPGQADYLLHKLACDLKALKAGIKSGGLAVLIAGQQDIGKTLLLHILTGVLGGRRASASGYLTEQTAFNADLASAESWVIDDGNPFTDRAARRHFANLIKSAVASDDVWVHGKGKDAFSLPLYRRLFIVTNLDSLDAMPEMEDSLMDKVMLFKATAFTMPEGLTPLPPLHDPKARKVFIELLDTELPYFVWYLENYQFPSNLEARRFGTVPYKNPELMAQIKELSEADEAHYLVQQALCGRKLVLGQDNDDVGAAVRRDGVRVLQEGVVEVETNALLKLLLNGDTAVRARQLFKSARALGCALADLKREHPDLYKRRESNGNSYWTVVDQAEIDAQEALQAGDKALTNHES